MASANDAELFQSFCRKYINKGIKVHFKDVPGDNPDDLSRSSPRSLVKRICLHKDDDSLLLTIGRLLFWWVEAKGLFDEYIYGMPSTQFHITQTIYPQVKLHFQEDRYEAADKNKKPIRSEISFRWRAADTSTSEITALARTIFNDLGTPPLTYTKGRKFFSYTNKALGYYFQIYANTEQDAKKIISAVYQIQENDLPEWDTRLKEHVDNVDYTRREYISFMGETQAKPLKRPVGTVKFTYAELFYPGVNKPVVLCDVSGRKYDALIKPT